MNKAYDLAIIGGGIAGLSLASSILHSPATRHLTVALVEANKFSQFGLDSPISNRTSSLTPSSVRFLQSSTAWDYVLQNRISQYPHMHVYDGVSDQQIEFEENNGIATMVENFNLQSALLRSLQSTCLQTYHSKVECIEKSSEGGSLFPRIVLQDESKIRARLIVGADGANSPVRQFAGIASHGWDYPHHGVVGTLTHTHSDHGIAHQRMLPSGPIAFLPLPENKASMVWSINPHYANLLKSLSSSIVAKFVNAAFRLSHVDLAYILDLPADEIEAELDWRLSVPAYSKHPPPKVEYIENVASFPLKFRHADSYHADRAVLIGDAAHTIHPLAGQGLNLALLDSAALQDALTKAVELGGDIGFVGESVSRDRYWANARVGGVVDKIHKLYARQEKSVVAARSLGSGVLDKIEVAKRAVMSAVG